MLFPAGDTLARPPLLGTLPLFVRHQVRAHPPHPVTVHAPPQLGQPYYAVLSHRLPAA
ncbi:MULTISPECIES: hypothetical protein [Nocardiopsis]|uniref:Uncharacterized protein n=1 Tax=Nocardiopsis sinuspersici TaxID=501010 RepID=A0A7Y9X8U6_9ACTN|nr:MULTISPECIES: hypothetical protein [Nocardiopsis]NYH51336.1 hypothetical protein [Nocardiopsis sinuspersici]